MQGTPSKEATGALLSYMDDDSALEELGSGARSLLLAVVRCTLAQAEKQQNLSTALAQLKHKHYADMDMMRMEASRDLMETRRDLQGQMDAALGPLKHMASPVRALSPVRSARHSQRQSDLSDLDNSADFSLPLSPMRARAAPAVMPPSPQRVDKVLREVDGLREEMEALKAEIRVPTMKAAAPHAHGEDDELCRLRGEMEAMQASLRSWEEQQQNKECSSPQSLEDSVLRCLSDLESLNKRVIAVEAPPMEDRLVTLEATTSRLAAELEAMKTPPAPADKMGKSPVMWGDLRSVMTAEGLLGHEATVAFVRAHEEPAKRSEPDSLEKENIDSNIMRKAGGAGMQFVSVAPLKKSAPTLRAPPEPIWSVVERVQAELQETCRSMAGLSATVDGVRAHMEEATGTIAEVREETRVLGAAIEEYKSIGVSQPQQPEASMESDKTDDDVMEKESSPPTTPHGSGPAGGGGSGQRDVGFMKLDLIDLQTDLNELRASVARMAATVYGPADRPSGKDDGEGMPQSLVVDRRAHVEDTVTMPPDVPTTPLTRRVATLERVSEALLRDRANQKERDVLGRWFHLADGLARRACNAPEAAGTPASDDVRTELKSLRERMEAVETVGQTMMTRDECTGVVESECARLGRDLRKVCEDYYNTTKSIVTEARAAEERHAASTAASKAVPADLLARDIADVSVRMREVDSRLSSTVERVERRVSQAAERDSLDRLSVGLSAVEMAQQALAGRMKELEGGINTISREALEACDERFATKADIDRVEFEISAQDAASMSATTSLQSRISDVESRLKVKLEEAVSGPVTALDKRLGEEIEASRHVETRIAEKLKGKAGINDVNQVITAITADLNKALESCATTTMLSEAMAEVGERLAAGLQPKADLKYVNVQLQHKADAGDVTAIGEKSKLEAERLRAALDRVDEGKLSRDDLENLLVPLAEHLRAKADVIDVRQWIDRLQRDIDLRLAMVGASSPPVPVSPRWTNGAGEGTAPSPEAQAKDYVDQMVRDKKTSKAVRADRAHREDTDAARAEEEGHAEMTIKSPRPPIRPAHDPTESTTRPARHAAWEEPLSSPQATRHDGFAPHEPLDHAGITPGRDRSRSRPRSAGRGPTTPGRRNAGVSVPLGRTRRSGGRTTELGQVMDVLIRGVRTVRSKHAGPQPRYSPSP